MPFTAAEWEEMRRADEEIEREFRLSPEDLERDRELTRVVKLERMAPEKRRIAAYQRAYREANRDSLAEKQRWIRDARKAHGYTQRDMARMLGADISTISRLESGELRLSGFKKRAELLALLKEGGDVSMQ